MKSVRAHFRPLPLKDAALARNWARHSGSRLCLLPDDELRMPNRIPLTSKFELHPSSFASAIPGQLFDSIPIPGCLWFWGKITRSILRTIPVCPLAKRNSAW